jgi:hypothetical protein
MCEYCGETHGCKLTGGTLNQVDTLNVNDWQSIYEFVMHVELPFIHGVILRSRERKTGAQHIPVPSQRVGTAGDDK